MGGFRHLGDRVIHEGHIWNVVVANFVAPDGGAFSRDVVRSRGAVAAVPVLFDAEGTPSVVLVRQYRPAFDRWLVEVPAGVRDVPGEPDRNTARRELIEEVGLHAAELELLGEVMPAAGMTDSTVAIFLATDLSPTERSTQGPEEASMEILHVPLAEALAMVTRGEIADAKTVIALLLAERRLNDGDAPGA